MSLPPTRSWRRPSSMRTASDTSVSIYPQYVVSYPLSWTSVNSLVYIVLTLHSDLCNRYCVPWTKQFDPIEALCKSRAPYNQGALRVPRGVQPLLAGICKLVTNEAGDDPPVSGTGTQLFRDTGGRDPALLVTGKLHPRSCARADNLTAPRFVSGLWLPTVV